MFLVSLGMTLIYQMMAICFKELQQDVSKRAPVVVRVNTTANQLADRTKQGSAKALVDSLKKQNSEWKRLKNKVMTL